MRNLRVIFKYISRYPRLVATYFTFNILSTFFGLMSLALLSPFLTLIFKQGDSFQAVSQVKGFGSKINPINYLKEYISGILAEPDGQIKALLLICVIVFIAIILKNLFGYLSLYVLTPIRNYILNDMRKAMYSRILKLPLGFFSEQKKGEVMSKLTNDINEVEISTISVLESLFREPITILLYLLYLIILSPQLTLFLIVFLPIAGFILGRIGRSLKKENTMVMQQFGKIFSTLEETLGGIRIIKAFNAEEQLKSKFDKENDLLFNYKNRANRRRDAASPVSEALGVTAVLCVLYYGGRLVLGNEAGLGLSAGDFLAYIGIFTQLIAPLKSLTTASYNIQKGAASIERIESLINEPVIITEKPDAIRLNELNEGIEFKNVSFYYGAKPILKDINLKVKKGETVALVGSSGSGKSTLADLIPRFIEASSGEVLINGKNIKEYNLRSLRSNMGIVTQEAILFNDSIANNIALGSPHKTAEEIEQAAKVANAYNFISGKENGFDTNVGDRGVKLSGGERQRLTIARAVLNNPPILILDEATSALDTESERLVQDAINHLMDNRTVVVIAHRLSTVKNANEIIVMQKGEIVERGTHESLLALGGFYKKLVDMQEVE